MKTDERVDGRDADFAIDRDAVPRPAVAEVQKEEVDAGRARELASAQKKRKKRKPGARPAQPAAPRRPAPAKDARIRPIWFLGTGPVRGEWDSLPEGANLAADQRGNLDAFKVLCA